MIEQLANSVSFFAHFVESKVSKTGLTVTVDVWEVTKTGTATEIVSAGSATEVGDGLYVYVLSGGSVDAEGEYLCVFKTATDTVDQQHIPALWSIQRGGVEHLDDAVSDAVAAPSSALTAYDPPTRAEATSDKAEILAATTAIETDTQDLQTQIGAAGAGLTALGDIRLANLDATVSSRLAGASYTAPDNAGIASILARLGAWTGSARNTLLGAMQALFRSDADATVPTDINADLGSGAGDAANTTDSLEAIRDRGDTAWITGAAASGSNTVTFTVRDSVSLAALIDVPVNMYASDGTSLVDSKRSGASGGPVFSLDSGSYYYAVPAIAGYSSVSNTALTVDGTETATVNLVAIAATSVSAGTRVVRVIVVDGSGALKSGVVVTANLVKKGSSIANAFATNTQLSDTTDANGIADLTLITSDQFEGGDGVYKIVVPGAGEWTEAIPAGSGAYVLQTAVV